jgi:ribose 5-phosphate isomerase B
MADRVAAGSDHAGLRLREEALRVVREKGYDVEDLGAFSGDSVD